MCSCQSGSEATLEINSVAGLPGARSWLPAKMSLVALQRHLLVSMENTCLANLWALLGPGLEVRGALN